MGLRQEALGGALCHSDNHRSGRFRAPGQSEPRHPVNFQRSSERRSLLSRCSVDACRGQEGHHSTVVPIDALSHQLENSRSWPAGEPRGDARPAYMRQLPFLLSRRQDDGHGHGRTQQRQGPLRHCSRAGADVYTQRRYSGLEYRFACGADASRLHVANLSRRSIRLVHLRGKGPDDSQLLFRDQFQGLSLPPGLLSHPGHPRLLQPCNGA